MAAATARNRTRSTPNLLAIKPSRRSEIESDLQSQVKSASALASKEADAEMESADALPEALPLSRRIDLIHQAFEVETVVEHQRPDRGGDANARAGRIAQAQRQIFEGSDRAPQIAAI